MATSSESKKKGKRGRSSKIGGPPSPSPESNPSSTNEEEVAAYPNPDRISLLPDEILTSIVSLLPLKEAAWTSILSPRWRRLWAVAPFLRIHIDDDDVKRDSELLSSCLAAVDVVLARHRGPIRSFRLSKSLWKHLLSSGRRFDETLDSWIKTLAQSGIQELTLYYKLPSQLLTCQSLRSLHLAKCGHLEEIVALPPNLRELKLGVESNDKVHADETKLPPALLLASQSLWSFELRYFDLLEMEPHEMPLLPNLRELVLYGSFLSDSFVHRVLSGCRFLDNLCLDNCYLDDNDLCIRSPSVRKLTFKTIMEGRLVIEDAPNLEVLVFRRRQMVHVNVKIVNAPKLRDLGFIYGDFPMLELGDSCFKDGVLTAFSTYVHSLKTLAIFVNLDEASEAKLVTYLLKCFPCLENLDFMLTFSHPSEPLNEEFWEEDISSNCLDHHLKVINMMGISGRPSHLALARFIVRNALPVNLRELTLCKLGFSESALSHVLSKCHFLDSLCLDECLCLNGLRVCSPSLLKLTVRDLEMAGGEFLVEDAPNLEMLMFREYSTEHMVVKIVNSPKLQVLGYIDSHVGMLEFAGACFQNRIVTKCSTRPYTLKTLTISVNLDGASHAKAIANLLNLFPCLENLCIAIDCSDPSAPAGEAPADEVPADEEFWDGQTSSSCLDYHLKTVSIKGFLGTPNQLALSRLFVCNARVIKEIYLFFDFGLERWEELVKREFLHKNKASADLQIIFGRDCDNHPKFSTWECCSSTNF